MATVRRGAFARDVDDIAGDGVGDLVALLVLEVDPEVRGGLDTLASGEPLAGAQRFAAGAGRHGGAAS